MCDTNTINMTFFLLKVQHTHKKNVDIVKLSKKLGVDTL
jgi:hypothetical protein